MQISERKRLVSEALLKWGKAELLKEQGEGFSRLRTIQGESIRRACKFIDRLSQDEQEQFLAEMAQRTEAVLGLLPTSELIKVNSKGMVKQYLDFDSSDEVSESENLDRVALIRVKSLENQGRLEEVFVRRRDIPKTVLREIEGLFGVGVARSTSELSFTSKTSGYELTITIQIRRAVYEISSSYTVSYEGTPLAAFAYPVIFLGENSWKVVTEEDFKKWLVSWKDLSLHVLDAMRIELGALGTGECTER